MKVLVVGGSGYIGGALTDILMKSDHDILVYDMLLYEESYRKPVPFVYGDIRDYTKLKMICTNPDLTVHRGNKSEYCAGKIASIFEKLGGKVTLIK